VVGTRILGCTLGLLIAAAPGLAPAQAAAVPLHLVTVGGTGEVSAKPDRARLTLGVESRNLELKKAEDAVNAVVRGYVKDAKALGAKDEEISTSGVSISPQYVWEENKGQRFTGYLVNRQIEVRVLNLEKLGDFILKATADGVTQVNPPALESTKSVDLQRQALAKAAEDARAKAKVLAETLGAKLGGVQRIAESGYTPRPVEMYVGAQRAAKAMDGNAEMGVSLAEIRFEASISADFDLLPP
jgi:uncharacterized protein YggE